MFGAFEHRAEFDGVGILEGAAELAEFLNKMFEGATNFFFVFETDFRPHLGRTAGYTGEIFKAGADEIQRVRAAAADDVDDGSGDDVREMADAGNNFVMFL